MIAIRACSGLEELEACVQLQVETWGYDVAEVVPRKVFLVAQKIGGQVIGAFDAALAGASKAPITWPPIFCATRKTLRGTTSATS